MSKDLKSLLLLIASLAAAAPEGVARAATSAAAAAKGVAVVELFTSQGCSSCPPAERVLADVAKKAGDDRLPVFTLAFHVDYWNSLGWADPFSSADYSARQQWYGQAFGLNQIYTPQMVVNGKSQFVGSDRAAADRAIADSITVSVQVVVNLKLSSVAGGTRVECSLPGAAANNVANVAVVEQGLATEVKRGENAGRRLVQPSVVRWFSTQSAAGSPTFVVPPLTDVKAEKSTIVVYVQRSIHDPAVLGASAEPLP